MITNSFSEFTDLMFETLHHRGIASRNNASLSWVLKRIASPAWRRCSSWMFPASPQGNAVEEALGKTEAVGLVRRWSTTRAGGLAFFRRTRELGAAAA
jgi:hypothetical protein